MTEQRIMYKDRKMTESRMSREASAYQPYLEPQTPSLGREGEPGFEVLELALGAALAVLLTVD